MSIWENAESSLLIGRSVEERAVVAWTMNSASARAPARGRTLLVGGMHGDEFATIKLLELFCDRVRTAPCVDDPLAVIALVNPDGLARRSRYNARGVDLNRNFDCHWSAGSIEPPGPHPWSEPESRALRDFIFAWQPEKVVALHWALAEIDADGPQSTPLAEAMWGALDDAERQPYRLRVTEPGRGEGRLQETYIECPGSLGQWCGFGLEYPSGRVPAIVTLELPYNPSLARPAGELPREHVAEVQRRWKADAHGYLRAAEPAVFKMLLAACHHGC